MEGGCVGAEPSKKKAVDSAINHFLSVGPTLKEAITIRTKRIFRRLGIPVVVRSY